MASKMVTKLVSTSTRLAFKSADSAQRLVVWGRPHVVTFIGHARRELVPPSPSQWSEIKEGANKALSTMKSGRWMQKTTREGFQNALVGLEIMCWFFVGEMIGRRSIIGYKV